jgi:hypothetical protein
MLTVGIGSVSHTDAYEAAIGAVQTAIAGLAGASPNVILLFASSQLDPHRVYEAAKQAAPTATIAGATTAGEISTQGVSAQPSVVAMALASDTIHFAGAHAAGLKADSHAAGKVMAHELRSKLGEALSLVTMFPDGLSGNGSSVVRGVLEELGAHFPVTGGSAGDDGAYKQTYQFSDAGVLTDSVVGLGWAGNLLFSVGVRHGWIPVGTAMKATKTEGAVVHELDGKPAISIYEDYFGPEHAQELKNKTLAQLAVSYPLGIKTAGSEELLLRAPFFVNEDGSIVCGGEVPQGAEIRLMVGSRDEAVAAAKAAAQRALSQLNGVPPKAAIIFSCHVRDKLFGTRSIAQHEIDAITEVLGDIPMAGFYTYAEQAPIEGEVRNIEKCNSLLHNETIVITLIAEPLV